MPEQTKKVSGSALWVLKQLCSEPLEELSELLADRVVSWRYKNQLQILETAHSYAERNAIRISPIGLKTLLPILDAASFQENASVQDMWSRLLVNSGVLETTDYTRNVAVAFLKSVKKEEIKVLAAAVEMLLLLNNRNANPRQPGMRKGSTDTGSGRPADFNSQLLIQGSDLKKLSGLDRRTFESCINTLVRFRLLKQNIGFDPRGRPVSEDAVSFTNLGWEIARLFSDKLIPDGF